MNSLDFEKRLNENNFSIRHQIKRQQMSIIQLEKRLKEKRSEKPKLVVPRGKMVIKAKGLVMRVKNDKAILDELQHMRHRDRSISNSDDEDEKMLSDYKTKGAPNLIIQSQVQNAPAPPPISAEPPPPPPAHPPVAYPPVVSQPPSAPIIYQHSVPHSYTQPIVIEKPVKYIRQPIHYVEEYVHPESVYGTSDYSYRESRGPPAPPAHSYREREYVPPRHEYVPPRHEYVPARHERREYVPARAQHIHSPPRHDYPPPSRHLNHSSSSHQEYAPSQHYQNESRLQKEPLISPYPRKRRGEYSSANLTSEEVVRHDIRPVKYKVLVSNLHPTVTLEDVQELFLAIDDVDSVKMLYPGVAEITYLDQEIAAMAVDRYHNRELDGQPMQLSYSAIYPKARRDSRTEARTNPIPQSRNNSIAQSRNNSIAQSRNNPIIPSRNNSIIPSRNNPIIPSRNNSIAQSRRGGAGPMQRPNTTMRGERGRKKLKTRGREHAGGPPPRQHTLVTKPPPTRTPRQSDSESVHSFTITM